MKNREVWRKVAEFVENKDEEGYNEFIKTLSTEELKNFQEYVDYLVNLFNIK